MTSTRGTARGSRIDDLLASEAADTLLGVVSADRVDRLIDATDQAFTDAGALADVVEQFENAAPTLTQGRAFEFLEALKFNQAAARAGEAVRARPTHPGDAAAAADILLQRRDAVVTAVQAKSFTSPEAVVSRLLDPRYRDMARLVPADKLDEVRHLVDRRLSRLGDGPQREELERLRDDLRGELAFDGIGSGGTTRAEAEAAVAHPALVAAHHAGTAALREVGAAAAQGALVGGGTRAVFAAAANAIDVRRGRQHIADAVIETMRATASAAVEGAAVGGGAQAIIIAARQGEWIEFAGPAAPRQIAQSVLTVAGASRRFVAGDIDRVAYRDEVGGELTRRLAGYYCGVAGQLLLPVPIVGGLVGAVVGHAAAGILLEAGLLSGGVSVELAEARERRAQVELECRAAIAHLEASRADLEVLVTEHAREMRDDVLPALERFDEAVTDRSHDVAVDALVALSRGFRAHVPFRSLEQFDAFMTDQRTVFRL